MGRAHVFDIAISEADKKQTLYKKNYRYVLYTDESI